MISLAIAVFTHFSRGYIFSNEGKSIATLCFILPLYFGFSQKPILGPLSSPTHSIWYSWCYSQARFLRPMIPSASLSFFSRLTPRSHVKLAGTSRCLDLANQRSPDSAKEDRCIKPYGGRFPRATSRSTQMRQLLLLALPVVLAANFCARSMARDSPTFHADLDV